MPPRKQWATSLTERRAGWKTQPSKVAAYNWTRTVALDVSVAAPGQKLPTQIFVWVDEGLGRGWEPYDTLDLAELAAMKDGVR